MCVCARVHARTPASGLTLPPHLTLKYAYHIREPVRLSSLPHACTAVYQLNISVMFIFLLQPFLITTSHVLCHHPLHLGGTTNRDLPLPSRQPYQHQQVALATFSLVKSILCPYPFWLPIASASPHLPRCCC